MNGNVLLIDDNKMDLIVACGVLEKEGYACHSFTNHEDALKWADESEKPQVIFLDLEMPTLSGFQLLPTLKKHPNLKSSPIVIISGKNQSIDVSKAISLGAIDYVIKPIDPLVLQDKIRKLTNKNSNAEFAAVEVNQELFNEVKFLKDLKIIAMSEFGIKIKSFFPIPRGEMIHLGCLAVEDFGSSTLLLKCLSSDKNPSTQEYTMQFTYVATTEKQRQAIRKTCRKLWIQERKDLE